MDNGRLDRSQEEIEIFLDNWIQINEIEAMFRSKHTEIKNNEKETTYECLRENNISR